jgi:hypothetical protein
MGERIQDTDYPLFLDTKSKEFLNNKTKKIMEVEEMYHKCHIFFLNY